MSDEHQGASGAPRAAIGRRLIEQTISVLRTLAKDDDANEHVNYCWWCQNDINGKDTQKQPHADDCPWTAARNLETELQTALRACADALAPPEPTDRVVYLIERVQAMQINGKATYWSGDEELPPGGETTDPWDACWFPRKQDAARVAVGRFGKNLARSGWQIVEHVFAPPRADALDASPTARAPGTGTSADPPDEVTITRTVNKRVDGYDAEFWNHSYKLLREAIIEHLDKFVHDDDVAEEAILIEAVKQAGEAASPRPLTPTPAEKERDL